MKILTNKKYRELTSHIATLEDKADLLSGVLIQNRQLSTKVSELEPIVEKFNHKKNLEKARKQKYKSKLKLQKKEATKSAITAIEMSEVEKFAREYAGKEVKSKNADNGYIVGYNTEEDVDNKYVLIGFKHSGGWGKENLTKNDVFILDTSMEEYETYWYLQIEEITLNK